MRKCELASELGCCYLAKTLAADVEECALVNVFSVPVKKI